MGYVGWIGTYQGNKDDPRHRVAESELVRELRSLGAVLFCKTSVPCHSHGRRDSKPHHRLYMES